MSNDSLNTNFDCVFFVGYPYYFPHFLPISNYFAQQGKNVIYVLSDKQNPSLLEKIAIEEHIDYVIGDQHLSQLNADYFFFANENTHFTEVTGHSVFLDHGVGTKFCNYELACEVFDSVLIEGSYRENFLQKELPQFQYKIHRVGFSKLDGFITQPTDHKERLIQYRLDPSKPTVLYAPTFFPSSIEKMSASFPSDLSHCNIIVKPHYMSLERCKYRGQQSLFKQWSQASNCYVASVDEYNLTSFIDLADIMISDESSAIFECVALNKPVIINRFLKLRWSYRLNPKKLLKRLDKGIDLYRRVGYNPKSYHEMLDNVADALSNPTKHESLRQDVSGAICGKVDGRVSQRIYDLFFK